MLSIAEMQELSVIANRVVDNPALEAILSAQEDASLRSPGVAAHYYRFLYRLVQMTKARLCLELGTHTGISAACMAEGNPDGLVMTVNCLVELWEHCKRTNVTCLHQDSLQDVALPGPIDLLFIDTNHNGTLFVEEFNKFTPFVSEDGVVFIDDINLFQCMKDGWNNFNPEGWTKFEIPVHGEAGFGGLIRAKSLQEVA